jgi:hypothetical protein
MGGHNLVQKKVKLDFFSFIYLFIYLFIYVYLLNHSLKLYIISLKASSRLVGY